MENCEQDELIKRYTARCNEQLGQYGAIHSRDDFLRVALLLPDSMNEYFYILTNNPVGDNFCLWLVVLRQLASIGGRLTAYGAELPALDTSLANAHSEILPLLQQLAGFCEDFLNSTENADVLHLYLEALSAFVSLFSPGLSLINGPTFFQAIVRTLQRIGTHFPKQPPAHDVVLLETLARVAKAAVACGYSPTILPLLDTALVSETFVPELMGRSDVSLEAIVDYYRCFAFSIVSAVATGNKIDDNLTNKADIFFKVLINLPSLHLTSYMADIFASGEHFEFEADRYVSSQQREEISFYYVLNCMFRARSLSTLVDQGSCFETERKYFVTSFNKRMATELDTSASASLSRAASVVSLTRTPLSNPSSVSGPTFYNMSSILSEGLYKEKLRLVIGFFNSIALHETPGCIKDLVKSFDFSAFIEGDSSYSDLRETYHILGRVNRQKYPGKVLYIKALTMIARLTQLLTVKFLCSSMSGPVDPENLLRRAFQVDARIESVLLVKDLVFFDKNGCAIMRRKDQVCEDEQIAGQFALAAMNQSLESCVSRLT